MSVIVLIVILVFVLVCAYPVAGLLANVLKVGDGSFAHTLLGAGMIVAMIVVILALSRTLPYSIMRVLYYGMGSVLLLLLVAVCYRLVYGVVAVLPGLSADTLMSTSWVVATTGLLRFVLIGYAVYQFEKPHTVTELSITSSKVTDPVRFVYFADTQYGSTSERNLRGVVDQINALSPQFVLFGGDIVDFDYYTAEGLGILAGLDAPLYWITGNHEYYHDAPRVTSLMNQVEGVTLLDDEQITLPGGVQVTAIDYRHATSRDSYMQTVDANLPQSDLFSVFLFHEPKRVEETAQRGGYDLQLYGHTHGGQIFPGILLTKAIYGAYAYGTTLLQTPQGATTIYTTFGAGLFGPRMRLGTVNELVLVTVDE